MLYNFLEKLHNSHYCIKNINEQWYAANCQIVKLSQIK